MFIDDTWAKTNTTRTRWRAPWGERLVAAVPHGHRKTITLVAALGHAEMRCSTTLAGPVNRDAFEALAEAGAGAVVMNNLSSYKGPRALGASSGARVR